MGRVAVGLAYEVAKGGDGINGIDASGECFGSTGSYVVCTGQWGKANPDAFQKRYSSPFKFRETAEGKPKIITTTGSDYRTKAQCTMIFTAISHEQFLHFLKYDNPANISSDFLRLLDPDGRTWDFLPLPDTIQQLDINSDPKLYNFQWTIMVYPLFTIA